MPQLRPKVPLKSVKAFGLAHNFLSLFHFSGMKKVPIKPQILSVNEAIMDAFAQADSSRVESLLVLQIARRKVEEYLGLIIGKMKFYRNGALSSEFKVLSSEF